MNRRRYVSEEEWEAGEKYKVPFEEKSNIVVKPEPKMEELYKWYPIVDEGEYWTDYDIANIISPSLNKIQTIVTNGARIYTYHECNLGWGTMAKGGNWRYMRIKID